MRKGFSLVELSIVLVILGLLVGGVLSGQSLIRAAELRSISTEYTRWITATQTFRDKYFALPGDMSNATSFWGRDATYCASHTGTNQVPGTCNGNADGTTNLASGGNTTGEVFRYWQQLALAGLIEGTYLGISSAGGTNDVTRGSNVPAARVSNGIWYLANNGGVSADSVTFSRDYKNYFLLGAYAGVGVIPLNPLLKPEEVWNIDTKLDDGVPGSGKVWAMRWGTCTNAANNTDYTTTYKLTSTSAACAIIFPEVF